MLILSLHIIFLLGSDTILNKAFWNYNSCLFWQVVYKLSGSFEQESLEKLVQFAYTGDLEIAPKLVRYVYVAANKLKVI